MRETENKSRGERLETFKEWRENSGEEDGVGKKARKKCFLRDRKDRGEISGILVIFFLLFLLLLTIQI